MASLNQSAMEILHRLKSTEPPVWLAPNPALSQETRSASQQLFSSLKPSCPKSPFEQLLIDGYDAEQIWQQIDILTKPLLSSLRREVKRFEENPKKNSRSFAAVKVPEGEKESFGSKKKVALEEEDDDLSDELEDMDMDMDGFGDEEDDENEDGEDDSGEEGSEEGDGKVGEGDGKVGEGDGKVGEGDGIEDGHFSRKELKKFLEKEEAREYGIEDTRKIKKGVKAEVNDSDESEDEFDDRDGEEDDDDEDGEEEDEDEDDEDELDLLADGDDEDAYKDIRYEDFYGSKDKRDGAPGDKKGDKLSTHEKELVKRKDEIAQLEKANLEPKTWTMQGEITAAKRPKNSALEVDLDFEHNARPAPVITEEVTASLEELIRKRILDSQFDDVQKPPSLPTKAPRELKELDDNKSKKGLGEVYEEDYVQKTDPASAPLSFSDEQKKEASVLFKKLCLKLDALSHFHFAPKPVIEEMVPVNVPALAMEETAPVAVSDAAMLAPEEIFSGKGNIKDETELTQAERKRRRANKKRKYKAEETKRAAKRAAIKNANSSRTEDKED